MMYCLPCNDHGLKCEIIRNNPEEILDLCSEFLGVTRKEMSGRSRKRKIVYARHLSMYLLHSDKNLNMTLSAIGSMFGGRDHSTVIHAVRTINTEFDVYDDVYIKAVRLYRHVYGSIKYLDLGKI
jgi:chromosomal replication initiator protein